MKGIAVSEDEYYEKKLEVAMNLLPQLVAKVSEEYLQDKKKRASLIYNCCAISEDLLVEVGISIEKPPRLLGGEGARSNVEKNPNIKDKRSITLPPASSLKEETSTDIGNRTAIRKLSEMLPSGK